MTPARIESLINSAHQLLDRDGLITIKFWIADLDEKLKDPYRNREYMEVLNLLNNDYYNGNIIDRDYRGEMPYDFVIISIGQSQSYDAHEFLALILSNMIHIGANRATVI